MDQVVDQSSSHRPAKAPEGAVADAAVGRELVVQAPASTLAPAAETGFPYPREEELEQRCRSSLVGPQGQEASKRPRTGSKTGLTFDVSFRGGVVSWTSEGAEAST